MSADNQPSMPASSTEGCITEESMAAAKAMIGCYLRPEGPFIQDIIADSIPAGVDHESA